MVFVALRALPFFGVMSYPIEETPDAMTPGICRNWVDHLSHVDRGGGTPVRRYIIALAAVLAGLIVTGCSTSLFMGLNGCNCFTLRRGVTPEQFLGTAPRQPQPQSSQKFQLGGDVWEVWVYDFDSKQLMITEDDWASEARENVERTVGVPSVTVTESHHQEYVAFRNGLLEAWGRGSLPGSLKGKTNDSSSRRGDGR